VGSRRSRQTRRSHTLNGIAQGYATDRVVERLRGAGLSATLVNTAKYAPSRKPDGTPWRVGLAVRTGRASLTERLTSSIVLVATSAGAGFRFELQGPVYASVRSGDGTQSVAVPHGECYCSTATEADALSTAFSAMPFVADRGVSWRSGRTCRLASSKPTEL